MNNVVLISDIHSNAPALEAVVEREGRDSQYLVLGDLIGLNGYPRETIELIRELDATVIAGNHDKAVFHMNEGHVNSPELSLFERDHTLSALSDEQIKWVRELPYMRVRQIGAHRICLTHALPWPEQASGYEAGNRGITKDDVTHYASIVADDYDWVFHGHSHEQYSLDCSKFGHDVHFVNPGSVGYANEYAVVDLDEGSVDLREIEYDSEQVRKHVQEQLPADAPHTRKWF